MAGEAFQTMINLSLRFLSGLEHSSSNQKVGLVCFGGYTRVVRRCCMNYTKLKEEIRYNWRDNDNDGGRENIGVVFRVHSDATVSVRWPTGQRRRYKFGKHGYYEVELSFSLQNIEVDLASKTIEQGNEDMALCDSERAPVALEGPVDNVCGQCNVLCLDTSDSMAGEAFQTMINLSLRFLSVTIPTLQGVSFFPRIIVLTDGVATLDRVTGCADFTPDRKERLMSIIEPLVRRTHGKIVRPANFDKLIYQFEGEPRNFDHTFLTSGTWSLTW
uniref:Uncharacterized protein n=1 Tax=Magallana gigas TaxID=29159 RepID=K1QF59_MAGGI